MKSKSEGVAKVEIKLKPQQCVKTGPTAAEEKKKLQHLIFTSSIYFFLFLLPRKEINAGIEGATCPSHPAEITVTTSTSASVILDYDHEKYSNLPASFILNVQLTDPYKYVCSFFSSSFFIFYRHPFFFPSCY